MISEIELQIASQDKFDVGAMNADLEMPQSDFRTASAEKPVGIVREFLQFLSDNKKWWLLPIVLMLLAFSLLAAFAATGAAPFIYTLF